MIGYKDSFPPKAFKNVIQKKKSPSKLNKMNILSINKTILLKNINTRGFMNDPFLLKVGG